MELGLDKPFVRLTLELDSRCTTLITPVLDTSSVGLDLLLGTHFGWLNALDERHSFGLVTLHIEHSVGLLNSPDSFSLGFDKRFGGLSFVLDRT